MLASAADSRGHGGTCPPLLQMAGNRGTVSRRTANKKLYWSSRKRSPKRPIVLLEPKSGGAGSVPPLSLWTGTPSPHTLRICSSATAAIASGLTSETNEHCKPSQKSHTFANYAHAIIHRCMQLSRKPRPSQFLSGAQSIPSKNPRSATGKRSLAACSSTVNFSSTRETRYPEHTFRHILWKGSICWNAYICRRVVQLLWTRGLQGSPQKVSHSQELSLNRIKNRQCRHISHQFWVYRMSTGML